MKHGLIAGLVVVLFAGCGLSPGELDSSTAQEQSLSPVRRHSIEARVGETVQQVAMQAPRSVQAQPTLHVRDVAAPDGTRVQYLLGLLSCGILTIAQGEATVRNGRFELPYDAQLAQDWNNLELFLHVDTENDGVCDDTDTVLQLDQVTVAPGATVDASGAAPSYVGCWLFQMQQP